MRMYIFKYGYNTLLQNYGNFISPDKIYYGPMLLLQE